ncbi:hypothetical protein EI94DRAFT_1749477, partial [Lactarius quietus]
MPMLYPEPAQTLLYAYPISRGAITLTHLNGSRSSRHMRRRTDSSGSHHIPPHTAAILYITSRPHFGQRAPTLVPHWSDSVV